MKSIIKIKENYQFRAAYKKGKTIVLPCAVVYVNKNRFHNVRLGITAGKKIGNAVKRNRAKRVITAAFRSCLPRIKEGYDFVIVARLRVLSVKSQFVAESFNKAFISAGIIDE